ncbi:MAG: YitT family protein [Clostridiales bacterium]|nr:YitT family protein [Clostridiales bacterium]
MKKIINEYLLITLGVLILSFGLLAFLFPSNLAVGGLTGFVMVLNNIFPMLPRGMLLLIFNIILFIMGFILIGKEFGAKTMYSSFSLSTIIMIAEKYFPVAKPLVDDVFLNLFFGILIGAIGIGIVFYQNASTGGTDIIARIINKYYHVDIGKSLLMADFIVVLLAGITFGLELGLYAMLGIILNSIIIDNIIEGFDRKYLLKIVSDRSDEIKEYIINDVSRGLTIYTAKGGYTYKEIEVLSVVMNKREFIKLKKFIAKADPSAFLTVANVREVFGHGFKIF